MAKEFAALWKGKDEQEIEARMNELHAFTAFNATIKSAFDMSLFDLAAKKSGMPLYKFLGGEKKSLETDLTIGIGCTRPNDTPYRIAIADRIGETLQVYSTHSIGTTIPIGTGIKSMAGGRRGQDT